MTGKHLDSTSPLWFCISVLKICTLILDYYPSQFFFRCYCEKIIQSFPHFFKSHSVNSLALKINNEWNEIQLKCPYKYNGIYCICSFRRKKQKWWVKFNSKLYKAGYLILCPLRISPFNISFSQTLMPGWVRGEGTIIRMMGCKFY